MWSDRDVTGPFPQVRGYRIDMTMGESGKNEPLPIMPGESSIRPLTENEFTLFRTLIYREAGIHLSEAKKALLVGRLSKRLRVLGLKSFREYYRHVVEEENDEEKVRMLDCICTNETHFFREPRQFEFLENEVFPEWRALEEARLMARRIRVWSAACSTGEEPYTLAMLLVDYFPPSDGWDIEILATDLSTRALKKAREAIWPLEKSEEIADKYLKRFMLKGVCSQDGKMKTGPEIRSVVRFQRMNLNDETYPVNGKFNLILCRNVLIYFDTESRTRVLHRLLDYLAPAASYIFLGHAESLNRVTDRVRAVMPTVYAYIGEGGSRAATSPVAV